MEVEVFDQAPTIRTDRLETSGRHRRLQPRRRDLAEKNSGR